MKLLETRRKPLSFFLLLSFIIWVNSAVFPVRAQEQSPDFQALKLIEASETLYQQESFDEALNKLGEAVGLAQSKEIKAVAALEMAYVKFLQGKRLLIFRFHIEEALKLNPAINVLEGNYKRGFPEAFQSVKSDLLKAERPVVEKPAFEKTANAKAQAKKRRFPWLGVILSLALVGGLVYYFLILKTTLQVDTIPSGARVYLDGSDTAKITPCQLEPALGSHTIKVVLEGYADLEREFVVKNGKNSLTIPLDLGTYSIFAPAVNTNVQREAPCTISWDSTVLAASAAATATAIPPASVQPHRGTDADVQPMGITSVNLELFQEDKKVADIAKGVANSGLYAWNVPASTAEGHNFKIHIVSPAASESHAFGPAFNLLGFKEDFSDNIADFWLPDIPTSWNTAGGYFSGSKTTAWGGCAVYDFFYSETSYTVESRMRWSEFSDSISSNAHIFIMLATSKNLTSNAGYLLGYSIDGTVSIYSFINLNFTEPPLEPPTPLFSAKSAAVNLGINNWNTIKVVHVDSTYTLYINDTMTYTFVDSTYNPNYLVLGFIGPGAKTSCDFDYVYMTVDPSTPKPGPETLSRRRR